MVRCILGKLVTNSLQLLGTVHSVCTANITSLSQNNRSITQTTDFVGLDLKPQLVPTLQKIWLKHGNIMKNSMISNEDMISRALESLATMVVTLEDTLAWSLRSALCDLKYMGFDVKLASSLC